MQLGPPDKGLKQFATKSWIKMIIDYRCFIQIFTNLWKHYWNEGEMILWFQYSYFPRYFSHSEIVKQLGFWNIQFLQNIKKILTLWKRMYICMSRFLYWKILKDRWTNKNLFYSKASCKSLEGLKSTSILPREIFHKNKNP